MRRAARMVLALASLVAAACLWLPAMHLFFRPAADELIRPDGIPPLAARLAGRHLELWTRPELLRVELDKMRIANAEWDFMGRSFLAWSLANMALREPAFAPRAAAAIDAILRATLELEAKEGMHFFLMAYGKRRPFLQEPPRSQFIDGEIALMLALRRMVEDSPEWRKLLAERVEIMVRRMEANPALSAESYPDECWTFCNAVALAAIRLADHLDGTDHSDLLRRWVALAQRRLIDPQTGLLISAYALDGKPIYGPEGSSIWMVSHCLVLVDEPFARRQYELAKRHMAGRLAGFGYAREWPRGQEHFADIDSGLVLPGTGASVAYSGLAMVAAGQFGDREFLRDLAASLEFLGFPVERDGQLRYAAANQVGEAKSVTESPVSAAHHR